MKKSTLSILFVTVTLLVFAKPMPPKPSFRPDWCYQLPIAENATYVYASEQGEGATKQEALNKAFCQVLESTAQRLGQTVNTAEIHNAVQNSTDYNVVSRAMKIPVKKVCDFYQQDPKTRRWTAYILCQVADKGYITPEFEACNVCTNDSIFKARMAIYNKALADSLASVKRAQKKEDGLAMLESFFVPGLGQMMKGSSHNKQSWMIEGGATLAAEVVLFSVGTGLYLGANKQYRLANDETYKLNLDEQEAAEKQERVLRGTSYAFFGLAVAVHGVNMYRAYSLRESKNGYSFYPAIIPVGNQNFAYGMGTTIKF